MPKTSFAAIVPFWLACFVTSLSSGYEPAVKESPAVAKPQKSEKEKSPLGGTSIFGEAPLPSSNGGKLQLPALSVPSTATNGIGTGVVPKDSAETAKQMLEPIPEGAERLGAWPASHYSWQASNTFSNPLYFEDAMLERHGHQCDHHLTPFFSGLRFFSTIPALPYLMTLQCPDSSQYSYGHWRAGSPAPCLLQRPPFQVDAAIVEAAAITGGVLIVP